MNHFFIKFFLPSLILAVFSLPSETEFRRTSEIKCSPEELKAAFAVDVFSVRDGDFYSGSTWSTGLVPAKTDNITISHKVFTNNQNVYIQGTLNATKGGIQFRGINEANFKGSGMSSIETPNDIGLWVEGNGQLNLVGEAKRSWTTLMGSAVRGALSVTVNDATGWKVGDVIVVVPTDKPGYDDLNWNDATNTPIDPMIAKFERRTITSIAGQTVSFAVPLAYDHLSVTSTAAGKTWTAEVENLTRSFVIEGTSTGRSHIFIKSTRAQTIKYIEGRFLGPRTPGYRTGSLVNGRYGLHFHHCMDGSQGSIVEGVAFHDIGNRVFVPHFSNGITFKNVVAHAMMEQAAWWDFQHQSHEIVYDGLLASLRIWNGVNKGSVTGIELGQGDNCVIKNSRAVYIHHGDVHQQAGFSWNADNTGVWIFLNNLAHSNLTGLFVWQNDNANHIIENYEAYNNFYGMHHGAYLNEYNFIGGILYNSLLSVEATQASTTPMFNKMILDGGGKLEYLVRILSSPVTAGQPNQFRECTFAGFTKAAIQMNTEFFAEADGRKIGEIILPTSTNTNLTAFGPSSIYNSFFRVQPVSGQSYQHTQAGKTNINPFSFTNYGTGGGLLGKYYNGTNFNSFAFERIEPVKFQQWSVDKGASPNGVHQKITPGGPYSVEWNGYWQSQTTGQIQFAYKSFGGFRLTVDDRLMVDRWTESNEEGILDAPVMVVEAGRKYKIKVQHFDAGGQRGVSLLTKWNGQYFNVPIYQLYAATGTEPPPANRPPVVSAGPDIITTDSVFKIEGSASDPDNNMASVKWTGPSQVSINQNLSDAAHAMIKVTTPGTYTLTITARDEAGLTSTDNLSLTYQKKPVDTIPIPPPVTDSLMARAGPDLTTQGTEVILDGSKSTGKITAVNWYMDSGPASWNLTNQNNLITTANRLVKGTYNFRLRIKNATGTISEDRVVVIVGSVPPPVTIVKIVTTTYYSDSTSKTVVHIP